VGFLDNVGGFFKDAGHAAGDGYKAAGDAWNTAVEDAKASANVVGTAVRDADAKKEQIGSWIDSKEQQLEHKADEGRALLRQNGGVAGQIASDQIGLVEGVGTSLYGAGKGLVQLADGVQSLTNLLEWVANPGANIARLKSGVQTVETLGKIANLAQPASWIADPKGNAQLAGALWHSAATSFNNDPAKFIGNAAGTVAMFFIPGADGAAVAGDAGRAVTVLNDVDKVAEVAKLADVADVANTADAANAAGRLGGLAEDAGAAGRVVARGGEDVAASTIARGEPHAFDVLRGSLKIARVDWSLLGEHNQLNALAAIGAAEHVGVAPEAAAKALGTFAGVRRRLELRGSVNRIAVYDDFAHHPTAMRTTIDGLRRKIGRERILAVFEPRSNTMKLGVVRAQLPWSLEEADLAFCHSGGLGWDAAAALKPMGAQAMVCATIDQLVAQVVGAARPGDHILCMSNGGFGDVHAKLLAALSAPGR